MVSLRMHPDQYVIPNVDVERGYICLSVVPLKGAQTLDCVVTTNFFMNVLQKVMQPIDVDRLRGSCLAYSF